MDMQIQEREQRIEVGDRTVRRASVNVQDLVGEMLRRVTLFPLLKVYTRPRVEGSEHLKGMGPYIFVANHASHLDAPLLMSALPRRLRLRLRIAAAADYFFTTCWKAAFVSTFLNAYAFERKGVHCGESLVRSEQLLREGYSILLFPEGTRSRDGRLQPFKRGVGRLALSGLARIVPVWIEGAYAALPKGARWPRSHRVTIRFGAPLSFTTTTELPEIVAEIERQVRALAPAGSQQAAITPGALFTSPQEKEMQMTEKRYGGIYAIKPWWQRRLAGLENLLIRKHIHPDVITSAGVASAGLLGITLAETAHWPLLAAAVAPLAVGRLAANALDGLVARRTGLARPWGEAFNECCDRLADILVFAGLALNPFVCAPLAWSVLVLTLLNSYLGIASKAAGGRRQFGGLLAKADRMIFLAAFSPLVLFWGATAWNWLLLAFLPAIIFTLIQRYRWTYNELRQVEERSKSDGHALAD